MCCYNLNLGLRASVYDDEDNVKARHNTYPRRIVLVVNGRDQVNARLCEVAMGLDDVQVLVHCLLRDRMSKHFVFSIPTRSSSNPIDYLKKNRLTHSQYLNPHKANSLAVTVNTTVLPLSNQSGTQQCLMNKRTRNALFPAFPARFSRSTRMGAKDFSSTRHRRRASMLIRDFIPWRFNVASRTACLG